MKWGQIHNNREDMQEESYNIIHILMGRMFNSYLTLDATSLYWALDSTFIYVSFQMPEIDRKAINQKLESIKTRLYANREYGDEIIIQHEQTQILDMERDVMIKLVEVLSKQGIIFKAKVDLDKIIAGNSYN